MSKKKDEGVEPPKVNVMERIFGSPEESTHVNTEAENVSMIITEWLDPKHIKRKTRLTKDQVNAITILQALADTYNIRTLKRFLDEFRTCKLSEDGQSSTELENILKARMPNIEETNVDKLAKFLE